MGMFDMLNLRINGYDFHVALMGGKESWTERQGQERVLDLDRDPRPTTSPTPTAAPGRTPRRRSATRRPACTCSARSSRRTSTADTQQDIIDDIDFFPFPELDAAHGQDAIEAPIDGFMMAASPANAEGAKALLTGLGQAAAIDAYIAVNPAVVAGQHRGRTPTATTRCSRSRPSSSARRSTSPSSSTATPTPTSRRNVVGQALADFLADPTPIDSILADVEAQKQTYTFE